MYWAAERMGGKIVHADNATKGRAYRCPNRKCNAEVFLRSGRRRTEHFAHMPGQGKPECEEFHYSGDLSRAPLFPPAPREMAHVDPLHLSIELEPQPHKGMQTKWRLRLTVPKSPDAHGQISIDLSYRDPRRISLTKLALGSENYTVSPDMLEFGANWSSHDVLPEYRDAVQTRIAGLDPEMGNAFEASRSKLKPRTYSLFWGESYYLVSKAEPPIRPPTALASRPLARINDWDCTLIALPHEPDSEIENWIEERCALTIARPTREWAILHPAPYALGDGGDLYIPPHETISLALRSSGVGPAGTLVCSDARSTASTELDDGTRQHLVTIADLGTTAHRNIFLAWDGSHVATIATRAYAEDTPEHAVTIVCDGASGRVQGGLHAAPSQTLLADVRRHRLTLVAIYGHLLLRGKLRHRQTNALDWSEFDLDFQTHPTLSRRAVLGEEIVYQINAALRDTTLDIEIDFGPFGRFSLTGQSEMTLPSHQPALSLPSSLRPRIEWFARACGSYLDKTRQPLAALDDISLLTHFLTLRVPTKLLAHQRYIDGQLKMLRAAGRL